MIKWIKSHKKELSKLFILWVVFSIFTAIVLNYFKGTPNILYITRYTSFSNIFLLINIITFISFLLLAYFYYYKNVSLVKLCFYFPMCICILIAISVSMFTHGNAIGSMLFQDKNDTFMDFFNSIQYGLKPYSRYVIYPPLINLLYAFLGSFLPAQATWLIRTSPMGLLVYFTYSFISVNALAYCIWKLKQGSKIEKVLFIVVSFLSLPFMYAFERGNSIILTLLFLFVYFLYIDCTGKKRIWGFIGLAISAAIKITPALFGIILLREKRYKDSVVAFLIGCFIFLSPFIFLDGTIFTLIHNIKHTSALFQGTLINGEGILLIRGNADYVNLQNTSVFLGRILNINFYPLANFLWIFLAIGGIVGILYAKNLSKWKVLTLVSCMIVLLPGFSGTYTLIYFLLPLIFFLDAKSENNIIHAVYAIIFVAIFAPIINIKIGFLNIFMEDAYHLRVATVIESISVLLLCVFLEIEAIYSIIKTNWNTGYFYKKTIPALMLIGFLTLDYLYVIRMKPVPEYYPLNFALFNASHGFKLKNGLYHAIDKEAEILLQNRQINRDGLQISYGDDKFEAGTDEELRIIIDGKEVKHTIVQPKQHSFVVITPEELKKTVNDNDKLEIRLNRNSSAHLNQLPISYIGPVKALNRVVDNTYLFDSAEGVVKKEIKTSNGLKNISVMINNHAKFLLQIGRAHV